MTKLQTSLRKYFRRLTGPSTPNKSLKVEGKAELWPVATKTTNPTELATQHRLPPLQAPSEHSNGETALAPDRKSSASSTPPEWRRDADLPTASRISWEDEIRIHRAIDAHVVEAAEFLRCHCLAEVDIVAIIMWTRRGCEAASRYVSRCTLASTEEDRVKQVEQACNDVEVAIKSACALVKSDMIVYICYAVSIAVNNSVETSLPSNVVCPKTEKYRLRCISQSRMFSVVFITMSQVLTDHFGPAPGIDIRK